MRACRAWLRPGAVRPPFRVRIPMLKTALALLLAFGIGAACRWFDVPVPAPPRILGALLILAITLGYLVADRALTASRGATPAAEQAQPPAP